MMGNIAILGAGKTGIGAALLAKKNNYEVFVSEIGSIQQEIKDLFSENEIFFEEKNHNIEKLLSADIIIKSPGIHNKSPIIKTLIANNKNVVSDIDFAYHYMKVNNPIIIAITGTNGKSTVTSMIGNLLKQVNNKVSISGNIGVSICNEILQDLFDVYVIEISNYQLEDIKTFKPNIALILNIQEDHLVDYENDITEYAKIKMSLLKNMDSSDFVIYPNQDLLINKYISQFCCKKLPINIGLTNKIIYDEFGIDMASLKIKGQHNLDNILFFLKIAQIFNIDTEIIEKTINGFAPLEHRLEFVKKINNISFYNDSKSTTVDSTLAALNSFDNNIIWLAGGVDKGNDYLRLAKLVEEKVKYLICIGRDNTILRNVFENKYIYETISMEQAIAKAIQLSSADDIVLLSPACASYDVYKNFEERGKEFKQWVFKIADKIISD